MYKAGCSAGKSGRLWIYPSWMLQRCMLLSAYMFWSAGCIAWRNTGLLSLIHFMCPLHFSLAIHSPLHCSAQMALLLSSTKIFQSGHVEAPQSSPTVTLSDLRHDAHLTTIMRMHHMQPSNMRNPEPRNTSNQTARAAPFQQHKKRTVSLRISNSPRRARPSNVM